jgi:hypothetical protein
MPETTFYVEGVQIAKRGIAMDLQRLLPQFTEIKFVESFRSEPKPELEPKPKTEAKKAKPKTKATTKPKKPEAKTKQKTKSKKTKA